MNSYLFYIINYINIKFIITYILHKKNKIQIILLHRSKDEKFIKNDDGFINICIFLKAELVEQSGEKDGYNVSLTTKNL